MDDERWQFTSRQTGLFASRKQSLEDGPPNPFEVVSLVNEYMELRSGIRRTMAQVTISEAVKAQLAPGQAVQVHVSHYESDQSVRAIHIYSADHAVLSADDGASDHFSVSSLSDRCMIRVPETVRFTVQTESGPLKVNLNDADPEPVRSEAKLAVIPESIEKIIRAVKKENLTDSESIRCERRLAEEEETGTITEHQPRPMP
jgi:hypothetical protein